VVLMYDMFAGPRSSGYRPRGHTLAPTGEAIAHLGVKDGRAGPSPRGEGAVVLT